MELFHNDDVEQDIVSRFKSLLNNYPDNIAVDDNQQQITYAELEQKSTALAKVIVEKASDDSPWVCLFFEQDIDTVVGMLATAKAGKGWVCLEPSMPSSRLSYIIEDASACAILSTASVINNMQLPINSSSIIDINDIPDTQNNIALPEVTAHSLCCLLYTSGSSGKPKGVMHTHRNLLHVVRKTTNSFLITNDDHIAMISPLGHVVGLAAAMIALMNGATLMPFKLSQNGFIEFAQWLEEKEIAYFHVVPSVYRRLIAAITDKYSYQKLRVIAIGGEQVTEDDLYSVPKTFSHHVQLRNAYGCTEAIDSSQKIYTFDSSNEQALTVSIGQPTTPYEEIKLLSSQNIDTDVAHGASGEVAVGSDYLALGYWNKEQQTAEKFLKFNGFEKRFYRTGDLAKLNTENDIVYVGRDDNQVKVNGYRIELEEVESKLHEIAEIAEAAVIFNPDNETLLAFYSKNTADEINVKEALAQSLPAYMLPSSFTLLDELPQLHNGKIDRIRLLEMTTEHEGFSYHHEWIKVDIGNEKNLQLNNLTIFNPNSDTPFPLPHIKDVTYEQLSSIDTLTPDNSDTIIYVPKAFMAEDARNYNVNNLSEIEDFVAFIKAIIAIRKNKRTNIIIPFITKGDEQHQYAHLNQATIAGICRSIPRETPNLGFKLIGFDLASFKNKKLWHKIFCNYQMLEHLTVFRKKHPYAQRLIKSSIDDEQKQLPVKPDGVYLITGGLGGLGLSLAQLLVESGAKHLILSGRNTPKNEAQKRISALESLGCKVETKCCDIAVSEQVSLLFAEIKQLGKPLAGVIHAAGTHDFDLIQNKTWSRFNQVLAPKLKGSWNLHLATKDMKLDFFVLISSITSELGFVGHSDYCAANSYLNALAIKRQAMGLPAISLNYGTLAGGMAESNDIQLLLKQEGVGVLSLQSAVSEFVNAIKRNKANSFNINADWNKIYRIQNNIGKGAYLSKLVDLSYLSKQTSTLQKNPHALSTKELQLELVNIWKEVLRKKDIDIADNFFDVGGDSLGLIALHLQITSTFNTNISVANLLENPTIEAIANLLKSSDLTKADSSSIVKISTNQKLPVLFMVNSTGVARDLSIELDSHFSIQSVNMFNLSDQFENQLDHPVTPRLANIMANDIAEFRNDGPIKLLGFCKDGALTVDVANELQRLGRTVDFVGLFDVSFKHRSDLTVKQQLKVISDLGFSYFSSKLVNTTSRYVLNITNFLSTFLPVLTKENDNSDQQKTLIDKKLYDRYFDEAFSRLPDSTDTDINLMVSREWQFEDVSKVTAIASKPLIVSDFDNDHMGFFSKKNIPTTAERLIELMN